MDSQPARRSPAPGEIAARVLAAKSSAARESAQAGAGSPAASAEVQALLEGLNPAQRAAVEHSGGPLLIVAGAGSGKTRVLTRRIAYLIKARGVRPSQILAITFTNKAAGEMKQRVAEAVGSAAPHWVSTFHSACLRILRHDAKRLGFTSSFSIYDDGDSQRLMKSICKEMSLDPKRFNPRTINNAVSGAKNELVDYEAYAAKAEGPILSVYAECYTEYQRRLRAANALDFDDIIMTTVNLLQAFPDVAEHYRRRFRHVLVDEYQDTNHAQYVLVRELVGTPLASEHRGAIAPTASDATGFLAPAELCVVGDADQSIYAFRGATIRNIAEFEADYPDAKTILLEQNYRSTQTILSAANAVIARNPDRKPKNLWTDAGAGERIVGWVAEDEHDEASFVGNEIDRLHDEGLAQPRDIAIFYRTNAASRVFEEVFIGMGMPYRLVGGTRFYDRAEIRDALAYLKALANPDDEVSLRRILNVPKRGIGDRAEACIDALAARERISFGAALRRPEEAYGIAARSLNSIRAFVEVMDGLQTLVEAQTQPSTVLRAILEQTGYLRELETSGDDKAEGRVENLEQLITVAAEYEETNPDGGVPGFLERVAMVADSDQLPDAAGEDGEPADDGGRVTLMTLHTAKGLEFPVVFLTGCEDGVFPHMRALGDPVELAEERRLAYVGLTRARERLYLTRAEVRRNWGSPQWFPQSRFVDDIPVELIDWQRKAGRSPLAALAAGSSAPPPRPTGSTRAPMAIVSLTVGDRVTHDTFGLGTVIATAGVADKAEATVDFGDGAPKRLLLRYAPVEKL
ncbi:MAG: DNA helicase PcrA [Sporichthyaceae bacterium]